MRKLIDLPYGNKKVILEIDNKNLNGVISLNNQNYLKSKTESEIVLEALNNPIGSDTLVNLAKGKKNIVIITSDHTRAVPSAITMPILLNEIKKSCGDAKITILIATGLHRGMSKDEMIQRFGEKIVKEEKILNHDAFNDETVFLGNLPSGSKFEINKIANEADLLIAEGFIEPHFFAGFSGGRKSILPGICSSTCVNINHSAPQMASPFATTGILDGNPIHEDMISAAKLSGISFILNVLLDENKKIKLAFAGDVDLAHRKGCKVLLDQNGVEPIFSDIVVTTNGGYPLDQNLYQCPKGIASALECINDDGIIIFCASCSDGIGGTHFSQMMVSGTPGELQERILATAKEDTIVEQWCVQRFSSTLLKYKVILVSEIDKDLVEKMGFIYASDVNEALDKALMIKGNEAKVTVIPDGVAVIVKKEK